MWLWLDYPHTRFEQLQLLLATVDGAGGNKLAWTNNRNGQQSLNGGPKKRKPATATKLYTNG